MIIFQKQAISLVENYSHDERFEAYNTRRHISNTEKLSNPKMGTFTLTTTFDVTFRDRA